ncbi:MAG: SpoIIE family protein phosphatase [Eubacterium sp.]|nr:SpoIIE family protein phosphatase [Eubacterium sp.]
MKKTIFRKIAWIILLIVLLSDAALLTLSYRIAYNRSYEHCVQQLENASSVVEEWAMYLDVSNEDTASLVSEAMTSFCEHLDLPYIYLLTVDRNASTIKYEAIGFGVGATEEAKREIREGTVKKLDIPNEIIEALDDPGKKTVEHLKNQYDDTLICYTRICERIDINTGDTVKIDAPMLIGVEISLSSVMADIRESYNLITVLLVVLSGIIAGSVAFLIYRKVSRPARMISARMSSFVEDYNKGIQPLPVKGEDEFAEMSRSFNTMAENISSYISNIDRLNQERHVRQAELDIAGNIQKGLLAKDHFRKPQYEVHACMFPARDVGGDLYDYLELEDGRMFLAVADVSGKGITASLFMSRAVTLLHLYAKMGYSPAQILKEYNNTLSAGNAAGLFITTFVAVYDPRTRKLTYSNGGHNIPYVLSHRLIPLDGAQGIAAGLFADEDFEEAEIRLKPGDCVFLYTDGVNEAQNTSNELFTTERLEDELSRLFGRSAEDVVRTVRAHVMDFAAGAEQSDDITMLAFQPTSVGGEMKMGADSIYHKEYHLPADLQRMNVLREEIDHIPNLSEDVKANLHIMVDEIFANICSYGYKEGSGNPEGSPEAPSGNVDVIIDVTDHITLIFEDDGKPFDPTQDLPDIDDYDHMNSIGGLGRFITFELADSYGYRYENGKNILTLEKNL